MDSPKQSSFAKNVLLSVIMAALIIALAAAAYIYGQNSIQMNPSVQTQTPGLPSATPSISTTTSPAPVRPDETVLVKTIFSGSVMQFTSFDLGIRFTYFNDGEIVTWRKGNKVCVTSDKNDSDCSKGQSVEVFNKPPAQPLKEAVTTQLLANIPSTDCFAEDYTGSKLDNHDYAIISYPDANDPNDPFSEATAKKCPENYRKTNGLRYFMSDKSTPEKFVFFSIGQFVIKGDTTEKPWQNTLTFITPDAASQKDMLDTIVAWTPKMTWSAKKKDTYTVRVNDTEMKLNGISMYALVGSKEENQIGSLGSIEDTRMKQEGWEDDWDNNAGGAGVLQTTFKKITGDKRRELVILSQGKITVFVSDEFQVE